MGTDITDMKSKEEAVRSALRIIYAYGIVEEVYSALTAYREQERFYAIEANKEYKALIQAVKKINKDKNIENLLSVED